MSAKESTPTKAPAKQAKNAPKPAAAKGGKARPAKAKPKAGPKPRGASALDGAARVLAEEGRPMSCKELVEAMAARGYWSSPAGKTPAQTLYSAILRETRAKGDKARFVKAERGRFALSPSAQEEARS